MMRTERYKYVSRTQEDDELYDLEQDPGERVNRIHDPAYAAVVNEMRGGMLKWLQTTADVVPYRYDSRFTPQMMWEKVKDMVPPEKEAAVRELIAGGATLPAILRACRG